MLQRHKAYFAARLDRAAICSMARIVACIAALTACNRFQEAANSQGSTSSVSRSEAAVELSPDQLRAIKLQKVGSYAFYIEKKGIGNIDFDTKLYFDNSLAVQVFPPRAGRIGRTLAELGDAVEKGQLLYTVYASDRAELSVASPIAGQVTAVNASPGLTVEPGKAPAPYAVADVSTKWLVASVPESDGSFFKVGELIGASLMAYPGRAFQGRIIKIYPAVDGTTHRVMIRSEIADPGNELRSGMLADFVVRVTEPNEATAIPANGVVREPDGTMTAWVTTDRHRFSQRVIKTGLRTDDQVQVLEGLQPGELAVSDGAVFLSNMLAAPPSD